MILNKNQAKQKEVEGVCEHNSVLEYKFKIGLNNKKLYLVKKFKVL